MVLDSSQSAAGCLEAQDLEVWRGLRPVLRKLSFRVASGELLHVRGPNGAGKTSLLRALAGFLWPEEGALLWNGRPIHQDRTGGGEVVSYLGHDNGLKGDLSASENLRFATALHCPTSDTAISLVLHQLGVRADATPVRALSAGQRRRVAMARVVLSKRPLWLLDEPFTNLDIEGARSVVELLSAHADAGGLVILAAHGDPGLVRARSLEL